MTAKAGKRRTIKPTLKKRHKHKRKRRKAHAATSAGVELKWVDADYPVVWVHKWTAPPGDTELGVMEKGMQEMVITDLFAELGRPDCPGAISASDNLKDVVAEIKLQESPYFDQSQRLTTAKLVRPNASLTGSMTVVNGLLTVTATYQDQRPGSTRNGTVSVTGPEEDIFNLERALIPKIVDLICEKTPRAYAGSFSGTWTSQLNDYKVTWTGDAVIELLTEHGGPPQDGPEPLDYAHYAVRSGKVHAILDGTRVGAETCTIHGEADFTLTPGIGSGEDFVQVGVDKPWFALNITSRGDEVIPYTETGLGCNQVNPEYPLTGVQFVFTPKPLQSGDGVGLTGNASWDQLGNTSHFTSAFTFTPAT